ncbi:hypothetical protein ACPVPU_06995 [Sphingomonas sp. CJ99]
MIRAVALSLFGVLALSACEPQPTVLENEAAVANDVAAMAGPDRLFAAPQAAIGAARQFGFQPTDYAAKDGGFTSTGTAVISDPAAASPNRVDFAATGPSGDAIDTIRFTLLLTDTANADAARQRTAALVRDYLGQFDLADDAVFDAVAGGQEARGTISGAAAFTVAPTGETITVTLTPPTPSASA